MKKEAKKVSEIQIIPVKPKDGLLGFASLVVFDSIYLSSIGIHKRLKDEGYRITYPTKAAGPKQLDVFHPINFETAIEIENAVCRKAEEVFNM